MAVKANEERVNVGPFLYDGEKYKDPINVIVNGVKYSVPRGKVVSVPKVVAEVLQQSMEQDAYARELDKQLQENPKIINF